MRGRYVQRRDWAHRLHRLAGRSERNRLRRPGVLAGTIVFRNRHLLDRMHGPAGFAIEDVEEAVLARLRERFDVTAADVHVEQGWRTARVVVPDVVMRLLEVPLQPAVAEGQRDDRVAEEIRARALLAVAVGIADRDVHEAERRIDRGRFPNAAAVALAADPRRPRDVPALILLVLRHGVEDPEDLAGLGVHREHMAAGNVALAAGAADVDDAVVDLRRR